MGDPVATQTVRDDMGGLYKTTSEAFTALALVSSEQEGGPVNGPEEKIATRGFHVAHHCLKTLRDIKAAFDKRHEKR